MGPHVVTAALEKHAAMVKGTAANFASVAAQPRALAAATAAAVALLDGCLLKLPDAGPLEELARSHQRAACARWRHARRLHGCRSRPALGCVE
jgi:hypothetical protein